MKYNNMKPTWIQQNVDVFLFFLLDIKYIFGHFYMSLIIKCLWTHQASRCSPLLNPCVSRFAGQSEWFRPDSRGRFSYDFMSTPDAQIEEVDLSGTIINHNGLDNLGNQLLLMSQPLTSQVWNPSLSWSQIMFRDSDVKAAANILFVLGVNGP